MDGAQVKYRVVREVRMPYWWAGIRGACRGRKPVGNRAWRDRPTPPARSRSSLRPPDLSVPEKDEPFHFQVYTDVTDGSGETRSAQHGLRAGYTALKPPQRDDWQTNDKAVELKIKTSTLDGQGQLAEGTLKIYRLQEPAQVHRPPLGGARYRWKERRPDRRKICQANNWPLGEVVFEQGFATDANGEGTKQLKLGVGAYRAMLETQDRFGKKVTALWPIRSSTHATTWRSRFHTCCRSGWSLEPGQEFTALWGMGYTGRAFIEIEHGAG